MSELDIAVLEPVEEDTQENRVRRMRATVERSWNRFGGLFITTMGLYMAGRYPVIQSLGSHIPEPGNFTLHAGNMPPSVVAGALIAGPAGEFIANRVDTTKSPTLAINKVRAGMIVAGLAVGLAGNALVETRFGLGISHWQNTADPLDLAYGTVAAGLSAAFVPSVEIVPDTEASE